MTLAATKGKCPYCMRDDMLMPTMEMLNRTDRMRMLLKRSVMQLRAWQEKYGENNPNWLPPNGEVQLLEDIDAFFKDTTK